jgi:hypothetical protein
MRVDRVYYIPFSRCVLPAKSSRQKSPHPFPSSTMGRGISTGRECFVTPLLAMTGGGEKNYELLQNH